MLSALHLFTIPGYAKKKRKKKTIVQNGGARGWGKVNSLKQKVPTVDHFINSRNSLRTGKDKTRVTVE